MPLMEVSSMWIHVYLDFSDLSKSEQLALFKAMKKDLFPEEREDIAKMLKDIRETLMMFKIRITIP